ncbi:GNAT family N-acetyltransferase [Crossiella sp. CA198]|uniref:GNAT family N-acetyltransferase n=1 Tax=Crossiella sp. CA198 TaxID=3455607 RepID=UPI003F8D1C5F
MRTVLKAGVSVAAGLVLLGQTALAAPAGPADLADAANQSWLRVTQQLISALPRSVDQPGKDSALLVSFQPQARMNGVFGIARDPDLGELARFAARMPGYNLPWVLRVRGNGTAKTKALASGYGLTEQSSRDLAVLQAGAPLPGISIPGAVVRKVDGRSADVFLDIAVKATGVDRDSVRELFRPELFDLPGAGAYVVERDGKPVATALGIRGGGMVAPYYLFALPEVAGQGYEQLATERLLKDSFAAGVKGALIGTEPTNEALARILGFRTVDTWTTYSAPRG